MRLYPMRWRQREIQPEICRIAAIPAVYNHRFDARFDRFQTAGLHKAVVSCGSFVQKLLRNHDVRRGFGGKLLIGIGVHPQLFSLGAL